MDFFEFVSIAEILFTLDVYKKYLWVCLLIGGIIYAVMYTFEAIALYTVAVKANYKNKWMAFIPFFNTYYIGVVSQKNRTFGIKARYISLTAAILEAICFSLYVLYYVAAFKLFGGGYIQPQYGDTIVFGVMISDAFVGYEVVNLPQTLLWAEWVFTRLEDYVIYWIELCYLLSMVMVVVSFFRTYAPEKCTLFSILSVLFPVARPVIMFCVRNNVGKSYGEYLRERQQRQYRMYQEYMRNMNGGAYTNGGDPYETPNQTPPDDPFNGLGKSNDKDAPEDPFSDL